jgi:formate dehydrogenase subunit gamma
VSGPRAGRVVRYTFAERLMHGVTGLSYVYLALSGLAFWTPGLYWIATVLGGGYLTRVLHPWAGVVFAVAVAWMFATWRRDMRTSDADREWRRAMRYYIRHEDSRVPSAGRFNYGQKTMFWVMGWASLALLLSGLVLWWPEAFAAARWNGVRQAAILVHAITALVTIGAFIVHLYMGVAVVPGGLGAILHGDVSESWAREHHALWADEVAARRPPPNDAARRSALSD